VSGIVAGSPSSGATTAEDMSLARSSGTFQYFSNPSFAHPHLRHQIMPFSIECHDEPPHRQVSLRGDGDIVLLT